MKCETQLIDIETKVRQDCYNRGYEQGRKNPAEEIVKYIEKLQNQVKEYQDKIEQGTLIKLPCKVGDTVYEVFKDHIPPFIKETKIEKIVITAKGLRLRLARNSFYETAISSFGKTLFFTREEAEKRLKELQE